MTTDPWPRPGAPQLSVGTRLSHYTIAEPIGQGGMGVVYRAVDARLDRTVALKVIAGDATIDEGRKQRFFREARAASALSHPNIVTIHEIDECDGVDFLVMELISGQPLDRAIPKNGLPVDRAIEYARQMASALATAHAAGIVHRDIKPTNLMVTAADEIKVLDFGLAKRLPQAIAADQETMMLSAATAPGVVVGTAAYMSPEQAQGKPTDAASDIFSFGAVLYEMLSGRRPFEGATLVETLAAVLRARPEPLATTRRDLPPGLVTLVEACLEEDAGRRPTAQEVVRRLTAMRTPRAASVRDLLAVFRRRGVFIPAAVVTLAAALAAVWWFATNAPRREARRLIPEIQRFADRDDYQGAYRLAREAVQLLPDDQRLRQLWLDTTVLATFTSNPPGAAVAIKGYSEGDASWIDLGRTPIMNVRVPFAPPRVRVSKDGFAPLEVAFTNFTASYTLDPIASVPPGMVRVAGGRVNVDGTSAVLDDYWLDRLEVTNREFKTFVDAGGYRTRGYWKERFVAKDRTLSWEEAMNAFRDKTGRPGPSTWELGTYPEGEAAFPVSGVSWYEAAAYAEFAGKALPTAFHWRGAGGYSTFGANFTHILTASNFGLKGPAAAGRHGGLGPFGTYDMAGNVKEWCWNEAAGGRYILGGAWNEPTYLYQDFDAQPPFDRLPTYGFRLAKYITPPSAELLQPVQKRTRDYATEKPDTDAAFAISRSLYRYDPKPLNSVIAKTEDAPDWRKETIEFDAAYGNERVRAYLYLPKGAEPPYQVVVYFPGGDATLLRSSRDLSLKTVDFVIRAGRAVIYPIYKNTYERTVTISGLNDIRDVTIARGKDVQRTIDFLETRRDIDANRIGYYGLSLGAFNGILVTAIEPRFKASVLFGGGLPELALPAEIDPINFAPRIRVPTLMINGRADFSYPLETSQLPLFKLLGPPADRKRHALFDGGHIPKIHDVIREVLDWFDRYLGPIGTS
jgi:dienelactone hydrolase